MSDQEPKVKLPAGMSRFTAVKKQEFINRMRSAIAERMREKPWEFQYPSHGGVKVKLIKLPEPIVRMIVSLVFDLMVDLFLQGEVLVYRGKFYWGPDVFKGSEFIRSGTLVTRREVVRPYVRFSKKLKSRIKEAYRDANP